MTARLRLAWPDAKPFAARGGRPIRLLAVSDEPDRTLDSLATRRRLGPIDAIVGCGDLQPEYLSFVADAFGAPMRYVRGNHDVGIAWEHTGPEMLPEPLRDGQVVEEAGVRFLGFSGSPRYNKRELQISALGMWRRVLRARAAARRASPLIILTHAPPRGVNDDHDLAHRGFSAFTWFAEQVSAPLWLHGHTALVRRGLDDRCARHNGTLFYNCTGATLIELLPPGSDA